MERKRKITRRTSRSRASGRVVPDAVGEVEIESRVPKQPPRSRLLSEEVSTGRIHVTEPAGGVELPSRSQLVVSAAEGGGVGKIESTDTVDGNAYTEVARQQSHSKPTHLRVQIRESEQQRQQESTEDAARRLFSESARRINVEFVDGFDSSMLDGAAIAEHMNMLQQPQDRAVSARQQQQLMQAPRNSPTAAAAGGAGQVTPSLVENFNMFRTLFFQPQRANSGRIETTELPRIDLEENRELFLVPAGREQRSNTERRTDDTTSRSHPSSTGTESDSLERQQFLEELESFVDYAFKETSLRVASRDDP